MKTYIFENFKGKQYVMPEEEYNRLRGSVDGDTISIPKIGDYLKDDANDYFLKKVVDA